MKLNRIITLCAMAATLAISATSLLAQNNNSTGDTNNAGQRLLIRLREAGGTGMFDVVGFRSLSD